MVRYPELERLEAEQIFRDKKGHENSEKSFKEVERAERKRESRAAREELVDEYRQYIGPLCDYFPYYATFGWIMPTSIRKIRETGEKLREAGEKPDEPPEDYAEFDPGCLYSIARTLGGGLTLYMSIGSVYFFTSLAMQYLPEAAFSAYFTNQLSLAYEQYRHINEKFKLLDKGIPELLPDSIDKKVSDNHSH